MRCEESFVVSVFLSSLFLFQNKTEPKFSERAPELTVTELIFSEALPVTFFIHSAGLPREKNCGRLIVMKWQQLSYAGIYTDQEELRFRQRFFSPTSLRLATLCI